MKKVIWEQNMRESCSNNSVWTETIAHNGRAEDSRELASYNTKRSSNKQTEASENNCVHFEGIFG